MRQLKIFSGKKSAFEITESFQFLFQSHTKHYHLYYLEVAFKTFLPWLIVYKKKNTLYITIQVIFIHSFIKYWPPTICQILFSAGYSSKQEEQKPLPSKALHAGGAYDKVNSQTHRKGRFTNQNLLVLHAMYSVIFY